LNRLPTETGVFILGDAQNLAGRGLGSLLEVPLLRAGGFTRRLPEVPANLSCSPVLFSCSPGKFNAGSSSNKISFP